MTLNLDPATREPAQGSLLPTLPGGYYTDEAQFALDRSAVFARSWCAVGRSEQVAGLGAFVRAEVAGQDVIVVRGRDGQLRGFKNLCRHRGAALCLDQRGSFDKTIRCAYHAWTYRLDGRLIAAPNAPDMPDLDRERYSLLGFPVQEWLGYVWVNLDAAAGPLRDQVRPQLLARLGDTATFERYRIEEVVVGHTIVYDVAANWKSLVENFMECYHCSTLHPELTAALPQFRSGWGTVSGGVGAGASLADGLSGFSATGRSTRARLPGLRDEDDRLFYGVLLLPNVFVILVPDHVAVFRLDPLGPGRTVVTVDWLFDAAGAERSDFDPSDAVRLLDVTNRQDFDACQRCQLGMRSPDFRGVLVPAEHVVTGFYDYYFAALRGAAAVRGEAEAVRGEAEAVRGEAAAVRGEATS